MIQAQLHGKAPSGLTWSEDMLTSSIFGMLKYLSSPETTINILQNSVNLENDPLKLPDEIAKISYIFWPRLQRSEPDLVLVLHCPDGEHLVGIEAKYLSTKSSVEDHSVEQSERTHSSQRDQLAREIEDLHDVRNYAELGIRHERILSIRMIYLTLESYMPRDDLQDTLDSIRLNEAGSFSPERLYWLSWKSMYSAIKTIPRSGADQLIAEDLLKYLKRKDLITFPGFTLTSVNNLGWVYANSKKRPINPVAPISWNYRSE